MDHKLLDSLEPGVVCRGWHAQLPSAGLEISSGTFRLKTLYGVPLKFTVEDWPITYDDLEPYYEKAEYELGVCGETCGPPRKKPYPMPPQADNREAEVLFPATLMGDN